MPRKNRKGKAQGKKGSNAGQPKMTKTLYEEAIAERNQELSKIITETDQIEEEHLRTSKEFEQLVEDFFDIKQCIAFDIKQEGNESNALNKAIEELKQKRDEERRRFDDFLKQKQNDSQRKWQKDEETIQEHKTTLAILCNFERERQEYLLKEKEISKRENKQKSSQAQELYDIDKQNRLELVPLRAKMKEELEKLFEPLQRQVTEEGIAERKALAVADNINLSKKIKCVGIEYLNLHQKLNDILQKKQMTELDLDLAKQRTRMASKTKKPKSTKAESNLSKDDGSKETERSEITAISEGNVEPKRAIDELEEALEDIEEMARYALKLEHWESRTRNSQISISEEQKQLEIDEDFAHLESLILKIAEQIDATFNDTFFEKQVTEYDASILSPKARMKEKMARSHGKLHRSELYRNWQMPRDLITRGAKQEAGIKIRNAECC